MCTTMDLSVSVMSPCGPAALPWGSLEKILIKSLSVKGLYEDVNFLGWMSWYLSLRVCFEGYRSFRRSTTAGVFMAIGVSDTIRSMALR